MMEMQIDAFAARFPRLHHATFPENLPFILRHGLLSAEELLRQAGWAVEEIDRRLSSPRRENLEVSWPSGERVTLRDQIPLNLNHLSRRFPHISTADYARNLGRRVFFWCSEAKRTATGGVQYRGRPQVTLVFDTARLLRDHGRRVELCRVNSGTILMPAAIGSEENRNPETMFAPLAACEWPLGTVKEVTLVGSLIDVRPYLIESRSEPLEAERGATHLHGHG